MTLLRCIGIFLRTQQVTFTCSTWLTVLSANADGDLPTETSKLTTYEGYG